jgi:hypothetical protein
MKKGNPADYRFLEINPAFEKHTGLTKTIIGKRVKEVIPTIENYWIETYGQVALTGEPVSFENYSAYLKKWYKINAYSPKKNLFCNNFHRYYRQFSTSKTESLQFKT